MRRLTQHPCTSKSSRSKSQSHSESASCAASQNIKSHEPKYDQGRQLQLEVVVSSR